MLASAGMPVSREILGTFGEVDIYLFDQLLKGRFDSARRVLDAGCGEGRNLVYLLRQGYECFGIDRAPGAIDDIRALAAAAAPQLPADNFVVGDVDALPWSSASMDAIICSAVLHFARDEAHFDDMMREMWRVLTPGGVFFARLASTIGIEELVQPLEAGSGSLQSLARRRVRVPDGSVRFVVDEEMLVEYASRLGGVLLDPIKTTIVQQQRSMTTWTLRKS